METRGSSGMNAPSCDRAVALGALLFALVSKGPAEGGGEGRWGKGREERARRGESGWVAAGMPLPQKMQTGGGHSPRAHARPTERQTARRGSVPKPFGSGCP